MKAFTYQPSILTGKPVSDTFAKTIRTAKASLSRNQARDKSHRDDSAVFLRLDRQCESGKVLICCFKPLQSCRNTQERRGT